MTQFTHSAGDIWAGFRTVGFTIDTAVQRSLPRTLPAVPEGQQDRRGQREELAKLD